MSSNVFLFHAFKYALLKPWKYIYLMAIVISSLVRNSKTYKIPGEIFHVWKKGNAKTNKITMMGLTSRETEGI